MTYNPIAVANYFLDLAKAKDSSLTPMKLQKLVFFAQGWNLALKDESLIDEQVEAWSYGPVIPSIYREFRSFGDRPIDSKGVIFQINHKPDGTHSYKLSEPNIEAEGDSFTGQLLVKVWDVYGKYSAIQLSNKTHEEGTPWDQIFKLYKEKGAKIPLGTPIPSGMIRDYFRSQIRPKANNS